MDKRYANTVSLYSPLLCAVFFVHLLVVPLSPDILFINMTSAIELFMMRIICYSYIIRNSRDFCAAYLQSKYRKNGWTHSRLLVDSVSVLVKIQCLPMPIQWKNHIRLFSQFFKSSSVFSYFTLWILLLLLRLVQSSLLDEIKCNHFLDVNITSLLSFNNIKYFILIPTTTQF